MHKTPRNGSKKWTKKHPESTGDLIMPPGMGSDGVLNSILGGVDDTPLPPVDNGGVPKSRSGRALPRNIKIGPAGRRKAWGCQNHEKGGDGDLYKMKMKRNTTNTTNTSNTPIAPNAPHTITTTIANNNRGNKTHTHAHAHTHTHTHTHMHIQHAHNKGPRVPNSNIEIHKIDDPEDDVCLMTDCPPGSNSPLYQPVTADGLSKLPNIPQTPQMIPYINGIGIGIGIGMEAGNSIEKHTSTKIDNSQAPPKSKEEQMLEEMTTTRLQFCISNYPVLINYMTELDTLFSRVSSLKQEIDEAALENSKTDLIAKRLLYMQNYCDKHEGDTNKCTKSPKGDKNIITPSFHSLLQTDINTLSKCFKSEHPELSLFRTKVYEFHSQLLELKTHISGQLDCILQIIECFGGDNLQGNTSEGFGVSIHELEGVLEKVVSAREGMDAGDTARISLQQYEAELGEIIDYIDLLKKTEKRCKVRDEIVFRKLNLMGEIFSFFDQRDLWSVRLVCKYWNHIAKREHLTLRLFFSRMRIPTTVEFFKKLLTIPEKEMKLLIQTTLTKVRSSTTERLRPLWFYAEGVTQMPNKFMRTDDADIKISGNNTCLAGIISNNQITEGLQKLSIKSSENKLFKYDYNSINSLITNDERVFEFHQLESFHLINNGNVNGNGGNIGRNTQNPTQKTENISRISTFMLFLSVSMLHPQMPIIRTFDNCTTLEKVKEALKRRGIGGIYRNQGLIKELGMIYEIPKLNVGGNVLDIGYRGGCREVFGIWGQVPHLVKGNTLRVDLDRRVPYRFMVLKFIGGEQGSPGSGNLNSGSCNSGDLFHFYAVSLLGKNYILQLGTPCIFCAHSVNTKFQKMRIRLGCEHFSCYDCIGKKVKECYANSNKMIVCPQCKTKLTLKQALKFLTG